MDEHEIFSRVIESRVIFHWNMKDVSGCAIYPRDRDEAHCTLRKKSNVWDVPSFSHSCLISVNLTTTLDAYSYTAIPDMSGYTDIPRIPLAVSVLNHT